MLIIILFPFYAIFPFFISKVLFLEKIKKVSFIFVLKYGTKNAIVALRTRDANQFNSNIRNFTISAA